jgi:hypothetical protein
MTSFLHANFAHLNESPTHGSMMNVESGSGEFDCSSGLSIGRTGAAILRLQLLWPPPDEMRGAIMSTFFHQKESNFGARESTRNTATLERCGVSWINLWEEVIQTLRVT